MSFNKFVFTLINGDINVDLSVVYNLLNFEKKKNLVTFLDSLGIQKNFC